eukprot:858651-Amphidinium_carterae.1
MDLSSLIINKSVRLSICAAAFRIALSRPALCRGVIVHEKGNLLNEVKVIAMGSLNHECGRAPFHKLVYQHEASINPLDRPNTLAFNILADTEMQHITCTLCEHPRRCSTKSHAIELS